VETDVTSADTADAWHYVVTFWLDRQTYAVPIESVIKISDISALTRTTNPEDGIAGMVEIAGRAVPAINLRHPDTSETPNDARTPVLTVQIGETLVAMLVDKVTGVARLPAWQVKRAAESLLGTVVYTPQGYALLLNLPHLFTAAQIQTFTHVTPVLPAVQSVPTLKAQI